MEEQTPIQNIQSPIEILNQWAEEQDNWVRLIVEEVQKYQEPIEHKVVEKSFDTLLQGLGLGDDRQDLGLGGDKANIEALELAGNLLKAHTEEPMVLKTLTHVAGVNALAERQTIEFDDHLTVVFGENGSGKTGYTRILKQAAGARTPKSDDDSILGDIRTNITSGTLEVHFKISNRDNPIKWYGQKGIEPLNQIKVFDTKVETLRVDGSLKYIHTPRELVVFEYVHDAIQKVEELVKEKKAYLDQRSTPPLDLFEPGTKVHELVDALNSTPYPHNLEKSFERLRHLAKLENNARKSLKDMEIKYSRLEPKTSRILIDNLDQEVSDLKNLLFIFESMSSFEVTKYNKTLADIAETMSEKTGLIKILFSAEQLTGEPGHEWQKFIKAGQDYTDHLELSQYPQKDDTCLYCLQPLEAKALELLRKYKEFLRGDIELRLQEQEKLLEDNIPKNISAQRIEDLQNTFSKIDDINDPRQLAVQLLKDLQAAMNLIQNRKTCKFTELSKHINNLTPQIRDLCNRLHNEKLELKNNQPDREELQNEIRELKNRLKLCDSYSKVEDCFENMIRARRLSEFTESLSSIRSSLTRASKQASYNFMNYNFEKYFEEECNYLETPLIHLSFVGEDASTARKKLISNYQPSKILSEGEHKLIALADFLAEIRMYGSKVPIIFDDPISSLDYSNIRLVAKRLLKLAQEYQVIIFTHNVMFVEELISSDENNKRQVRYAEIFTWGKLYSKGIVISDANPRSNIMNNLESKIEDFINEAKAIPEQQGSSISKEEIDNFNELIQKAAGYMRTWCEVFTEIKLFGGIVKRHRTHIQLGKLKDIKVDKLENAINIIAKAFYYSSDNIDAHSQSLEQMAVRSDINGLDKYWKELKEMKKEWENKKNGKIKRRSRNL